jgi:hypothetical protein
VLVLSDSNFQEAISTYETLLVEFYAPVRVGNTRVPSPFAAFRCDVYQDPSTMSLCASIGSGVATARSWHPSTRVLLRR